MTACPYCRQPLKGDLALPYMSKRQQKIYQAVVEARKDGIGTRELIKLIGSRGKGAIIVLRVQVHEINKKLLPFKQMIKGAGGIYRFQSTGE